MPKDPHTLPHASAAQIRSAKAQARAIIQRIEAERTKAGDLISAYTFERHPAIAQVIAFELAPLIAADLVPRSMIDPKLNRAVGRRGAATLENAVLSRALTRIGRRARGIA